MTSQPGPIHQGVGRIKGKPTTTLERTISREEFGDNWPFTVERGTLGFIGRDGTGAVTFTADGVIYALNGLAMSWESGEDVDVVWLFESDPERGGPKKSLHHVINAGLALDDPHQEQ